MTQNAADAFLEDARGAKSLDVSQPGTTPGNSTIKTRMVGTALDPPGVLNDQASFFIYPLTFGAQADGYVEAAISVPASPRYDAQQLAIYIFGNPLPLRNLNITGATDADALSGMQIMPQRVTPMGQAAFDTINISDFQTAQDFQDTRVQVPMALIIDGVTYVDSVNECTATGFAATFSWLFGPRLDRRLEVPEASAVQIRSPGR